MGGSNGGAHPATCEPGAFLPDLRQDSMGAAGAEAARVAAGVTTGSIAAGAAEVLAGVDTRAAVGAAAADAMGTEVAAIAGADAAGVDATPTAAIALDSAAVAVCGMVACRTAIAGGCKLVPAGIAETQAGMPTTPTIPSGCE